MHSANGGFVETFVKRSTSLALVWHLEANQKEPKLSMGISAAFSHFCAIHTNKHPLKDIKGTTRPDVISKEIS
jgi:hypothetical protein